MKLVWSMKLNKNEVSLLQLCVKLIDYNIDKLIE
jgi:hypothetical protein